MIRVDYEAIRLIDLIIKEGGVGKAATKLDISQSAVSQRIKVFERSLGELVLMRTVPPRPTALGQKLLTLLHHVSLIEHDLLGKKGEIIEIPISINMDSLAIWFLSVIKDFLENPLIKFNISVDNENKTLNSLLNGEVVGAISSQSKPIIGGKCDYIGSLDYVLAASPAFAQRYFPRGVTKEALLKAPIISFNKNEDSHQIFLQQFFGIAEGNLLSHVVPSSEAYVQLVLENVACCMIPKQQIALELANNRIINLVPELLQRKKLYWHRYELKSTIMDRLTEAILSNAAHYLNLTH